MHFPAEVEIVFELLRENGYKSYAVGGCVRDFLLQKTPYDYDIATDALPEEVLGVFAGMKVVPTGLKHGTATVFSGAISVEITTFRTEGAYLDNRRPSEVHFSKNIADDLKRRDFTINAIAYSPFEGYVDFLGGKRDLEKRLIRCVGDAGQRFKEDALRLLRALRLAAELGFDIEEKTAKSIHQQKNLLMNISVERINAEFTRLLISGRAGKILAGYRDVVEVFLPELRDDPQFDSKTGMLDREGDLSVKLALLLKDEEKGVRNEKAIDALKRLKYDNQTQNEVNRLLQYSNKKIVSGKKQIKVWMNMVGDDLFFELLLFKGLEEDMRKQKEIAKEILKNKECHTLSGLAVKGGDLIGQGIEEGIELGKILKSLLCDVIMERVPNRKDKLLERARILHQKYCTTGV